MKKLFVLLLAGIMMMSMLACNKGTSDNPKADGAKIEANLWTLIYDDTVWSYDAEDDYSDDEEYSEITLAIPDGEDENLVSVEILASVEKPSSFRSWLTSYGFDEYEYAVNNAYDFVKVGGVDCLKQDGNSWGETCIRYFNRVESAGASVKVEIVGACDDERVEELLKGLTFNLKDTGSEDGPWYWEGEPFSGKDATVQVGNVKLESKWIPFEDCLMTKETFEHDISADGNKVYILSEGVLKLYDYDGKTLKFNKDIETGDDDDYEYINADENGNMWISAFTNDLIVMKDGKQIASYEGADKVAMHPSGKWGVSWFSSGECEKITISGDSITNTPLNFAEVDTLSCVSIDDSNIYVSGSDKEDNGHKVFIYDYEGKLQKTLLGEDGENLGSIQFFTKTKSGYLGLDGNLREVVLWSEDGKCIGTADDSDLFGTYYPWLCGGVTMDDGSIMVIMTEDRADESAKEVATFIIKGFN